MRPPCNPGAVRARRQRRRAARPMLRWWLLLALSWVPVTAAPADDSDGGSGDAGGGTATEDSGDTPAPADEPDEEPPGDPVDAELTEDPTAPPPRLIRWVALPSTAYNPDDGFGAGGTAWIQRNVPPAGVDLGRPLVWKLDLVARLWLKPKPTGWELYARWQWYPRDDGRGKVAFVVSSNGFAWDWWYGTGTGAPRDRTMDVDEPVVDYWHRYQLYQVRSYARWFRDLDGPLRVMGGVGVQGNEALVREGTLLEQEASAGSVVGLGSSVYGTLEICAQLDGRDAVVDPTRGGLLTLVAQTNIGEIDGFGMFGRLVADVRGYLGPPKGEVVLAAELAAQMAVGEVPFHELGILAGFEAQPRTLTGITGLRGQDRGRIRGPLTLLGHLELRVRPPGFNLWPRFHIRVIPALWADAARVDAFGEPMEGPVVVPGFGGGIRAALNEISIIRLDMGTGPETVMTADGAETQWGFKFYTTAGHAF